jgi:hypothetical protein
MKKQIVPLNENVETKKLADRSELAKLYYEPKKVSDAPPLRSIFKLRKMDVFIPAIGLTLPFAAITTVTIYLFRTPLDLIPFASTFFVFLAMFILMGIFYASYRKIDDLFQKLNVSIKSLLLTYAAIVIFITFILYSFVIKYLGEYGLVIFLGLIDVSGALGLMLLTKFVLRIR